MMKHLALLACLVPTCAQAGWVDDIWTDEVTRSTGSPAITINADGSVAVVLQQEFLDRAGLDVTDAARAFLQHFGPRQCSHLLDLNRPHPGLVVNVYLESGNGERTVVGTRSMRLTIDYVPSRQVRCVTPGGDLVS
ncbi:MAG: hypothetical protein IRY94_14265 [Rhodospirillaceae bacterium]|nr:hypothetical protein [Rhodospirillaceae bacterium]